MKKIKTRQSGFTLIETFVAIVVLTIAVLGPMTLLSRALQDSRYIKDEIIATFLAQEGVEQVIDKRNNKQNLQSSNCYFKLNDLGYICFSGQNEGNTVFNRVVTVTQLAGDQYKVESVVTRTNRPGRTIESSSIIFK